MVCSSPPQCRLWQGVHSACIFTAFVDKISVSKGRRTGHRAASTWPLRPGRSDLACWVRGVLVPRDPWRAPRSPITEGGGPGAFRGPPALWVLWWPRRWIVRNHQTSFITAFEGLSCWIFIDSCREQWIEVRLLILCGLDDNLDCSGTSLVILVFSTYDFSDNAAIRFLRRYRFLTPRRFYGIGLYTALFYLTILSLIFDVFFSYTAPYSTSTPSYSRFSLRMFS